jgi:hypothetical protein
MQSHDFLRKAICAIPEFIEKNQEFLPTDYCVQVMQLLGEAKKAVKFVLPENGRIFDTKFKALPSSLKLPFPSVLIEYRCTAEGGVAEELFGGIATAPAPKRIVYAEQMDNGILVASAIAYKRDDGDLWQVMPYYAEILSDQNISGNEVINSPPEGLDHEKISGVYTRYSDMGGMAKKMFADTWEDHAYTDMFDEVCAVLSLIEALSCKNVGIEKMPTRKANKSALKRGAMLFDEYHLLTVSSSTVSGVDRGGSHRSPREHLRRGHIRRLESGNIWVNSTVVNAGNHGKIHKAYALEAA